MNRRRGLVKNVRILASVDGAANIIGVDAVLDVVIVMRRDYVID